ncbi:acetyl-CoA carboxylase biotin carboxyl carrier protein subunit [Lutibacter sp. HS1-25]|uniref:acetyl-CoA carboxylase biotin carboxyl carrier protein subunit n=1 Tax=Lutibacter sp. HS1-25 TaxID=2485000 RepID=UPI0010126C9B|nr:acetyl-CoA carboxylase biotin carboxyl carrier protein subunit [Lutibacter sp. HS1-25]RXP63297.1 acetyl-CoA carboxylase biotin carboxyl carrier protein subunit [Lutibacter sp. HS1-25]
MDKYYKVKVNESFEYDLNSLNVEKLDILNLSPLKFHVLHNTKPHNIQILQSDFNNKEYNVKVNANNYTIKISNELDNLINKMGFSEGADKKTNIIKAPMPGSILKVNVKPNQKVKEGEVLLILEAMKMENTICAPKDGVIKVVKAKENNTVEKGELLIELF